MKNILWYKKYAKCFEEALPVGNGRIGAMVYGNPKKERISLNEDSLWSGYPQDFNKKDAHEYLEVVREKLFCGDIAGAEEIVNRDMHGHWSEAYLPFGYLNIDYKGLKGEYKRELNIENAISKMTKGDFTETVFCSNPSNLLVINLKSKSSFSAKITIHSDLNSTSYTKDKMLILKGNAPEVCMPPYYNVGKSIVYGDKGMNFYGAVKPVGNVKFSENSIDIFNEKEVTLYISLATSFVDFDKMPNGNAKQKALKYFDNIKDMSNMISNHIEDYTSLFNRVDINLGDSSNKPTNERLIDFNKGKKDDGLVALLFQYGRYLTISSSRKGTNCSTLQGIWNEKVRAPWSSNYTLNINTQMNYFPVDTVNLSECIEPLLSLQKKLAVNGSVTAKDYYGCSGYVSHHNSDIWGNTYPAGDPLGKSNSISFACWHSSSPWILNALFNHYKMTNDNEFLKELKPLMQGAVDFYKDFLIEKDGQLVTAPSLSPENSYNKEGKHSLDIMPSMDIEIIDEFFKNASEIGIVVPNNIKKLEIANDGRLMEWSGDFKEAEVEHRHISHLYCVYPSNLDYDEKIYEAAKKSMQSRGFGGTGWSLAWKVCVWARLKNGENAYKLIKNQLRPINKNKIIMKFGGGSYPNLLDAHPPFQIDGNFGITAGIAEMALNGAIPSSWKNGYIKGLKTFENKTVDVIWENGKITKNVY